MITWEREAGRTSQKRKGTVDVNKRGEGGGKREGKGAGEKAMDPCVTQTRRPRQKIDIAKAKDEETKRNTAVSTTGRERKGWSPTSTHDAIRLERVGGGREDCLWHIFWYICMPKELCFTKHFRRTAYRGYLHEVVFYKPKYRWFCLEIKKEP